MWITEGVKGNPLSGALLADTGARPEGSFSGNLVASATVIGIVRVQHRNAANDATVEELFVFLAANSTIRLPLGDVDLTAGERVRVVMNGAIIGSVQAAFVVP